MQELQVASRILSVEIVPLNASLRATFFCKFSALDGIEATSSSCNHLP